MLSVEWAYRMAHTQARSPDAPSVAAGWKLQPVSARLLRAFLGITFLYAGIQKMADPNFWHAGSADYIGSQLAAFSRGSPIGGLLRSLPAVPTGVLVAVGEIAIGVGTLLGVAAIAAALGGLLVSVSLFLSATWHVHPYFLGSDSVYAVAWGAYVIALVEMRKRLAAPSRRQRARPSSEADLSRRRFLRGAVVAGFTILVGGVARALAGAPASGPGFASGAVGGDGKTGGGHKASPTAGTAGRAASPTRTSPTPAVQGKPIAPLASIPVGGAIAFEAPGGTPAALVRLSREKVVAYSRVCTHAGCLVGYSPSARLLVCPCHGAEFDPARGGVPLAGPAPTALPAVRVAIDRSTGQVVLPE